jgi:hypothetical protein
MVGSKKERKCYNGSNAFKFTNGENISENSKN